VNEHPGIVTLWAHGKAHVRLEDGRELVCMPANKVRGQVVPGTRVLVALSPDGTVGRITARVGEQGRAPHVHASERRRQALEAKK